MIVEYVKNLIEKYYIESKSNNIRGKLILRNYPQKFYENLISSINNEEILFVSDKKLEVSNYKKVESSILAQYRNENVKNDDLKNIFYIVFITDNRIDTLNDLATISVDELKNRFLDLIDLLDFEKKEELKKFFALFLQEFEEADLFEVEEFVLDIVEKYDRGYSLNEAIGESLIYSFKCRKCVKLDKLKEFFKEYKKLSNYFYKNSNKIKTEELKEAFEENRDDFELLDDVKLQLIKEFIKADISDENYDRFRELDYYEDLVYKLFEKISTPAKKLGAEIIDFLESKDIELNEEKEFLEEFDTLKTKEKEKRVDELKEIYEKYKPIIESNPKLLRKIEKFIYPQEIVEDNFFVALIKLISEVSADRIEITLNKKNTKAINETYSKYALNYLKSRLFVINKMLDRVKFNINLDFEFENEKTSSTANNLKFIAKIYKDDEVYEKRFTFRYPVKSILNGYKEDVEELIALLDKNRLSSFKTYINKNFSNISLKEYASFEKRDKEGYRFVDDSDDISNILEKLDYLDFVDEKEKFKEYLFNFLKEYKNTLIDVTNAVNLEKSYIEILKYFHKFKDYDRFKREIIKPFLNLAVVKIEDDLIIIPAYHPLRLISFYYKLKNLNKVVNDYFDEKEFIKEELFFDDLIYDFTSIHYPEIFKTEKVLKVSEIIDEYSMLEDVKKEKLNKSEEVNIFANVIKEYIELNKHKKNIKIFLHSLKHLFPVDLMDKLSKLSEDIDIYFNDLDEQNIRDMYKLLLKKENIFKFSEVGFISNVKLNTMKNSFKAIDEIEDKFNLAFLKDFITNKAKITQEEIVSSNVISSSEYTSLISKRRYFSNKEEKISKYLINPLMNEVSKLFYTLIDEKILALSINRDDEFSNLEKIHSKSDWVVNLDEIADKKIIEDYGANVIKYKKNKYLNKNLIISSKANTKLLEENLHKKLNELKINYCVKEIIKEANKISGDLVLKALKQGKFANELIGVVLSERLLKSDNSIIVYIDDYENYFKQNSTLSDLLIIKIEIKNNKLLINIEIVESKFCSKDSNLENKSFLQAKNAYEMFSKIFSNEEFIDKRNYLIKIADLIVENLKGEVCGLNSEEIRYKMLFEDFDVSVKSYSFMFYYDSEDECETYEEDNVIQYKFNIKDIREILENNKKLNTTIKGIYTISKRDVENIVENKKVEDNKKIEKKSKNRDKIDEKIKKSVIKVLRYHNIKANILDIKYTPNAIRVSLKPELGWKESILYKTKDDFLTVEGLELLRVEALKGRYDLVFKRESREIVYYKDLIQNRQKSEGFGNTKILVGLDESSGKVIYYDLDSEDPHALIGGMTKSGKSVLLNLFIIDLITTNSPDELRLFLIDPKQVEFIRYKDIPHLEKIVTKKEDAIEVLRYLVDEMERRYSLFMKEGVNEIKKYNKKSLIKLPRIVVIFDEFADWMLDKEFKNEVSNLIQSLSGKARAAGIHLIISTQRPSNDVVVPILRANLGAKFALRVDSEKNSNIILDEGGAEKLLGYGHMIAKFAGEKHYIQGAFISDEEIDEILSKIKQK